ncbi:hypothetical protein LINGRAHAP2_LOCUS6268, partial [Linum grandiflorum]
DSQGQRIAAFAANLGRCTITRAEIRSAIFGLRVACELGFRNVELQLDSTTSISAITSTHSFLY